MLAGVMKAGATAPVCEDFPRPAAREGVLVGNVLAAALTRFDMMVAGGQHYFRPPAAPFVVGREAVLRLEDGRRMYGGVHSMVAPWGSMAEQALVDPACLLPVPEGVSDALAAALGNAGLAAWLPLSWRAKLKKGERVLVLGATGTSGLIAVAVAKLLGAGRIVAAGRNAAALERARALGADAIVMLDEQHDLGRAYEAAAGGPLDVVLDYICGAAAAAAIPVLAQGARMVLVGTAAAPRFELPGGQLRRTSADILGFANYHAPIDEQARAYASLCQHAAEGRITMDIEPLELPEIASAWQRAQAGSSRRFVMLP